MKKFYKIEQGKAQVGSGTFVPDTFIEYIVGQEPQKLLEALALEKQEQDLIAEVNKAKAYLVDTDHKFYNGYKPKENEDLVAIELSRDEAREFIRLNKINIGVV